MNINCTITGEFRRKTIDIVTLICNNKYQIIITYNLCHKKVTTRQTVPFS